MARGAPGTWLVALAAALALGTAVPALASWISGDVDHAAYRILTATVPEQLRAGERYTFIFGIRAPGGPLRSTLRFCSAAPDERSCRARSVRTLEVEEFSIWRSLGTATLPAGAYRGELRLMTPTRLGTHRTVAQYAWNLDVR